MTAASPGSTTVPAARHRAAGARPAVGPAVRPARRRYARDRRGWFDHRRGRREKRYGRDDDHWRWWGGQWIRGDNDGGRRSRGDRWCHDRCRRCGRRRGRRTRRRRSDRRLHADRQQRDPPAADRGRCGQRHDLEVPRADRNAGRADHRQLEPDGGHRQRHVVPIGPGRRHGRLGHVHDGAGRAERRDRHCAPLHPGQARHLPREGHDRDADPHHDLRHRRRDRGHDHQ